MTDAILLAAGFGRRMRPLTDVIPKPLLTLGGRALLDRALDALGAAGVRHVVVNAHWKAELLEAHLATRVASPRTVFRHEARLLDTGGAVVSALGAGVLGRDGSPFFVMNSDSMWFDGPVPALERLGVAFGPAVDGVMLVHRTFQVHADVGSGDFFLDSWGLPRRRREREVAPYIYAGVTLARPALFEEASDEGSMNDVWDRAIAAGRLLAVVHDGLWFHLTRPEDLDEAEHALAAQMTGPTT